MEAGGEKNRDREAGKKYFFATFQRPLSCFDESIIFKNKCFSQFFFFSKLRMCNVNVFRSNVLFS